MVQPGWYRLVYHASLCVRYASRFQPMGSSALTTDYTTEIRVLTTAIRRLEGAFPETVWPLPLFQHRSASLSLLQRGRSIEDVYIALDDLDKAHTAHRTLHGRATVTTVWMRIQMFHAHEDLVGKLLHVGNYMRKWQSRRRMAVVARLAAVQRSSLALMDGDVDSGSEGRRGFGAEKGSEDSFSTDGAITKVVGKDSSSEPGLETDTDMALSPEEEREIVEGSSRLKGVKRYLGNAPLSVRPQPPRRPKVFTVNDIEDEARMHVDRALEAWSAAREEWRELSAGVDGVESGKWLLGRKVHRVWEGGQTLAGYFGVDMGMRGGR